MKKRGHPPWENFMNNSFSTLYIAAVQVEISPMKIKCMIFSKDENFEQILCHCMDEILN